MADTPRRKPLRDLNGIELRMRARQGGQDAEAELRRRVGNLRGACIPYWEREARGQDLADWDPVL